MLRGRLGELRRELRLALRQAIELGSRRKVVLLGGCRLDRRGAQLLVDDCPPGRRPGSDKFVLKLALGELIRRGRHRRRMALVGVPGRGCRRRQLPFEVGEPRGIRIHANGRAG